MGELNTILGELGHVRRELQGLRAYPSRGARLSVKNDLTRRRVGRMGGRRHTALVPAALVLLARRFDFLDRLP